MPTNQRNSRSNSSRSINCRSERIEENACNSMARSSFSGGIEGRPLREYNAENSPESATSASFTTTRMIRSGWSLPTRPSRST